MPRRRRRGPALPWGSLPDDIMRAIFFMGATESTDPPCYLPPTQLDLAPLRAIGAPHAGLDGGAHFQYGVTSMDHGVIAPPRQCRALGGDHRRRFALTCRGFAAALRDLPHLAMLRWVLRARAEELLLAKATVADAEPEFPMPDAARAYEVAQRALLASYAQKESGRAVAARYGGRRACLSENIVHDADFVRMLAVNLYALADTRLEPNADGDHDWVAAWHLCSPEQRVAALALAAPRSASAFVMCPRFRALLRAAFAAPGAEGRVAAMRGYIGTLRLLVRASPHAVRWIRAVDDKLVELPPPRWHIDQATGCSVGDGRHRLPPAVVRDALRRYPDAFVRLPMIDRNTRSYFIPAARAWPRAVGSIQSVCLARGDARIRRFMRTLVAANHGDARFMRAVPIVFRQSAEFVGAAMRHLPSGDIERRARFLSHMPKKTRTDPALQRQVFNGDARLGHATDDGVFIIYAAPEVRLVCDERGRVCERIVAGV